MATKKVIYFTAGSLPTTNELADIAKLNAAAQPDYEVHVYKAGVPQSTPIRAADYVAHDGATIPTEYSAVTVMDPDNIPLAPLPDSQAIVIDGDVLSVKNSAGADAHSATLSVSGNSITALKYAATIAVVDNNDSVNVENSAGNLDSAATAVVASGVLTSVKLASTKTILTTAVAVTGVTVTGSGTTATPTIVNGVLTAIALS